MQVLAAAGLVVALAIGHVYLRFVIGDIKMQHRGLQQQREDLFRQAAKLQRENAELCDMARLQKHAAEDLQMVESDPKDRVTAYMPLALRTKYAVGVVTPSVAQRASGLEIAQENARTPVERLLLTITDMNRAFAADARDK